MAGTGFESRKQRALDTFRLTSILPIPFAIARTEKHLLTPFQTEEEALKIIMENELKKAVS